MSPKQVMQLQNALARFLETDRDTAAQIIEALDDLVADTRELKQDIKVVLKKLTGELT